LRPVAAMLTPSPISARLRGDRAVGEPYGTPA